ncbi:MAG: hypothetical protein Q7U76_08430 [Nitrospirota bacterium]|nr:hypothetical protein [Nitrospirota bacterium]
MTEPLGSRQPVRPIQRPFPGESVLGISPPLDRTVAPLWNRRAHLYTGRSLSDTILTVEQTGRVGHLTATGAMLSSGTVQGLDVVLERSEGGEIVVLLPGYGVTSAGEDVVVARPQRVRVADIPVIVPGLASGDAPVGERLGSLLASGDPVVGMLVLQPVVVEQVADADPTDPCEQDPQSFAFEDWQVVDGCRLCCVLWQDSWLPRPAFDAQWRNRLAYALFDWEQRNPSVDSPWNLVGLPVAMIGGQGGVVSFLDSAAVVRMGGKRPWHQGLLAQSGTPFVWQARLQQFAEQVAEMQAESVSIEAIAQACRFLPPAGLLPKDALAVGSAGATGRAWTNRFFPEGFIVDLAPIPIEQLDAMMTACASLAPLNMTRPERVRVLVPVPQSSFEPDLLLMAQVDPEFQATIAQFAEVRGKWLRRRADLREMASALNRSIVGTPLVYEAPDPEALETEVVAEDPLLGTAGPLAEPEDAYGTTVTRTATGPPTYSVTAFEALRTALDTSTPLSDAEVAELSKRGLSPFVEFLEEKIRRANDTVDFGFLQVQTNIYRMRQIMLGSDAASRLVTSPALASIAQGESALATREDLANFLKQSGGTVPTAGTGPMRAIDTKAAGAFRATSAGSKTAMGLKAASVVRSGSGLSAALSGGNVHSGLSVGAGITLDRGVQFPGLVGGVGAVELARTPSVAEVVKEESSGAFVKSALTEKVANAQDVVNQAPIIGKPLDFRTVSVAERLKEPPAPEAKNFSVASKFDLVSSLAQIDLNIEDVRIPGFLETRNGQRVPVEKTVKEIRDGNLAGQILQGVHDPDPTDGDEGAFFSAGVRAVDHTVATLRMVEGRIAGYRQAIGQCQAALAALQGVASRLDQRLHVVGQELAEARHDVGVARALLAEESARVNGINDRRERILREQVSCYAFVRPRQKTALMDVPMRSLDPGLAESPVPACLAGHEEVPQALRAMVALFRHAPVKWFPRFPGLLEKLDRVDMLQRTIVEAKASLQALGTADLAEGAATVVSSGVGDRLGLMVSGVYAAQRSVVMERRLDLSGFDASQLANTSWTQMLSHAHDLLSLGDVLEGRHGQAELTTQVSRELADMANVAACLYAQFGDVRPVLRLEWAERLSQFDAPANLRNLSTLPRWAEVEPLARRSMQTLADWLYGQVDARNTQAVGLMHDLVRMCLLLASHAPVNQIIAGHVEKPTTVKPGSRIPLVISPGAVRVGMHVSLYAGSQIVAQGLVEDVGNRQAIAHVMQTALPSVTLSAQAVAHFTQAAVAIVRAR